MVLEKECLHQAVEKSFRQEEQKEEIKFQFLVKLDTKNK
tara:strand:- start:84 stop:200 length:117 start_codon:yes stop_codon:yes gene_type:complete